MLKSMNFLSGKSREKVGGGTKLTPLVPVILGLVPRILWKQGTNLVNKFALLLHKCWLREDSWDKPKNDWCRERGLSDFCQFFKYPSPEAYASPSPSRGEGMHRPWCNKILGTEPSMTGGRGAGFVRLLRFARNDVNSAGRSMIEMLGVLAIIAVLSVGGIAGYSKAMEKFKINKIIEEYNYFIAGLLEHLPDYEKLNKDSSQLYLTEFAIAANLTPTTWKNYDDWTIIDSQNHMVWPFVRGGHLVFEIGIVDQSSGNILPHSTNLDYCRALYRNVMQPLHGAVSWVAFYRHQTDNSSYVYYGDGYCGNENKCLSELTLNAIDEMCKSCTDKNPWCHIVMTF